MVVKARNNQGELAQASGGLALAFLTFSGSEHLCGRTADAVSSLATRPAGVRTGASPIKARLPIKHASFELAQLRTFAFLG